MITVKKISGALLTNVLCLFSTIVYADAKLIVKPEKSLLDQPVHIFVKGALPQSAVKISASMTDENGRHWQSSATFLANDHGVVNLWKQAPTEGSYTQIDPMGLFWSMRLDPQTKDHSLFWKKSVEPLQITITAEINGKNLQNSIERDIIAKGVTKQKICAKDIAANLFLPKGKGPFPAVVVLGGSEGGLPVDAYAAQFANHGYATLALAYYQAAGLPKTLSNIPVEYFGKAVGCLRAQPEIDNTRLGIVGSGTGGIAALLAASYYPQLQAVVALGGSGVIFQSIDNSAANSMFSYQNKPLPFIPIITPDFAPDHFPANFYLRLFLGSVLAAPDDTLNNASIPVENINGPVLMLAGGDDEILGSNFLLQYAYQRFTTHQFAHAYGLHIYNGAGATLGVDGLPNTPTTALSLPSPLSGQNVSLGGNPQDTAAAESDSWKQVFAFLDRYLKDGN